MTETSLRRGNGIHGRTAGNYDRSSRNVGNQRARDVSVYKEGVGDHPSELMAKHEMQEPASERNDTTVGAVVGGGTCSK